MAERFVETFTVTVEPSTISPIDIGEVVLNEGDDTIWIKVTSLPSGGCPWPWSYGLLTWITENGRELGTVKINGVCEGEVFRLGVGLSPLLRTGRLSFTPRSYNTRWVELGHPWSLTFSPQSGNSSPSIPSDVANGAVASFDPDNGVAGMDFAFEDAFAALIINFLFR